MTVTSAPPPNQAPTARFTFAPASPTVSQSVAFDATSSSDPDAGDTLTYAWTFGDGATATGATAAHAYAAAGPFTVTLTVTDGHGGSDSATQTVTVTGSGATTNRAPVAVFTASATQALTGVAITLDASGSSDPDGDPLTFAWSFGDTTSGAGVSTTKAYASAGSFTITLVVSDGRGGATSATREVTIAPQPSPNLAPIPSFTASTLEAEAAQAVAFDASGSTDPDGDLPLSFSWAFGDGTTATGSQAAKAWPAAGTYDVVLTVTDAKGLAATTARQVNVVPRPAGNQPPTAVISGPVSGEVGLPLAFDGSASTDPEGGALTFEWSAGTGVAATGAASSFVFDAPGARVVTLTVRDAAGASSSASTDVTITVAADRQPPFVSLAGEASALPGETVTFTATATDNVAVAGIDFTAGGLAGIPGASDSTAPYQFAVTIPPVASPGQAVTVTAVARDAAGNTASASASVAVSVQPDSEPPLVTLSAPSQTSPGATLRTAAQVVDAVGVARVVFLLGSTEVGSDTEAPYEMTMPVAPDAVVGSTLVVTARAFDAAGNMGDAVATISVAGTADTVAPVVTLDAPADVPAGTVLDVSATVTDAGGVARVAFAFDGAATAAQTNAPFQASQVVADGVPDGTVITVTAEARDFADNVTTASKAVRVSAPPVSLRGIVTGEVYDDATGLPLAGASVSLDGADSTNRRYAQATTTDARGRYLLRATAGSAVLHVARIGYTRVDRAVTIAGGVATEAFDARLTPFPGAAAPVSPTLGATLTSAGVTLAFAPGTLATATAFEFAAVSAQGLRAPLPAGWSPVVAVDLAPAGIVFAGTATARAANTAGLTPGTPLVLAQFDATARRWMVVSVEPLGGDGSLLDAALPSSGQFALLVGDAQPVAPPSPVVGQALEGVAAPVLPAALASMIVPQPRVLFYAPGVHSLVTGRTEAATRLSSGARVIARITERYDFFDGGAVTPEPFEQDLVFYQVGAPGLAATHVVGPSRVFDAITLREGVITVAMFAPATSPVATPLVSAGGTRLETPTGEALIVPAGAVTDATPVTLGAIPASDPGIAVPDGVTVIGGVSVDAPEPFLKGAVLSMAAALASAADVVLVRATDIEGQTRLELVAAARLESGRLVSDTTVGAQATAMSNVLQPGRYFFVQVPGPIGYAQGIVTAPGGSLAGALVTTSSLPIVSRSRLGGVYVAVSKSGAQVLAARDLVRNDTGLAATTIVAAAVVPLDITLVAQPPRVTSVSPANDAVNVPLGSPVVVSFSEEVDPASVTANGGAFALSGPDNVALAGSIAFANGNTVATFRPDAPLASNTRYTFRVSTAVRDLSGNAMPAPVVIAFDSLDTSAPPPPPAGSISATIPGANGRTTVKATQGTASPRDTVTIVNTKTGAITPVLVGPNGGFEASVAAGLADRLQIRIVDRAGNETLVEVPVFSQQNADGSVSTAVDAGGGTVVGPSGLQARVKAGTFPDGAVVTLRAIGEAAFPVQLSDVDKLNFSFERGFEIDFGGATPQKYVDVSFDPRGGETADDRWIVTQVVDVEGRQELVAVDTAKFRGGRITTASLPCPGVTARGFYGVIKAHQPVGVNYGTLYASNYGGMRAEVRFIPETILVGVPPLPYVLYTPPSLGAMCYPSLTGRATVSLNSTEVTVASSRLAPNEREIVVRDPVTLVERRTPVDVAVEYSAVIAGTLRDTFEAEAVPFSGAPVVLSTLRASTGQVPDTMRLSVDIAGLGEPIKEIVFRNRTRSLTETVTVPVTNITAFAPGGTLGPPIVMAVNDAGVTRAVFHTVSPPVLGAGNLVARVLPGTIDPSAAECPTCGRPRERVEIVIEPPVVPDVPTPPSVTLPVPEAAIVGGGLTYAFIGSLENTFLIRVRYTDGTIDDIRVPRVQFTLTNPRTGRAIRTVVLQAPPRDIPSDLGTITDDTTAPRLIEAPSFLGAFDPGSALTFRFSKPMNTASLQDAFRVFDSNGNRVLGTFSFTGGNTVLTFVPLSPLRIGQTYKIEIAGLDASGNVPAGAAGVARDISGTVLRGLTLELKTFTPRLAGRFAAPYQYKDFAFGTATNPAGQTVSLVYAATASQVFDKFTVIDATNPTNMTRLSSVTAPAPTRHKLEVLKGLDFAKRKNGRFQGDLAFTTTTNLTFTFLSIYDVTNPFAPSFLSNKLLTANPDNSSDYARQGTVRANGAARGFTLVETADGPVAYVAVEFVGLFQTSIREQIPEREAFPLDPRDKVIAEPYTTGNFSDVAHRDNRLFALNRDTKSLEVFDLSLAPITSLSLNGEDPRRIKIVEGLAIDRNGDGLADPDEQYTVALIATRRDAVDALGQAASGSVLVIDISSPSSPTLLTRIETKGILRDLDVDVTKRRVFAAGEADAAGPGRPVGQRAVYMLDLSRLGIARDDDGNGEDDRVLWKQPLDANSVRFDTSRGLLAVGRDAGMDLWAVYDTCCDLGVDTTAAPTREITADRASLLRKERDALQVGIKQGLTTATTTCGAVAVTMLEQGSGACLWKADPASACGDNYQPGISDHDFEVMFPAGVPEATQTCVIKSLTDVFLDARTNDPRPVPLPGGDEIVFDEVSFFPILREEFEQARLNIDPPTSAGGTDVTGDIGLGRQQLLLKWLLEGEYVILPGNDRSLVGADLEQVLSRLRAETKIPALEGYEWAALQRYKISDGGMFLRVADASQASSAFHKRFVKQAHDAGKAGIRAALGRLVADPDAAALVLRYTRAQYGSSACLSIAPRQYNPMQWPSRPCQSFEEFIASMAARTLLEPLPTPIFTPQQVVDEVHRFYRIKADVETLATDEDGDQFIAMTHRAIERMRQETLPAWQQGLLTDPQAAQRLANVAAADSKYDAGLTKAKLHAVPRVFNRGFRAGYDLRVAMYHTTTAGVAQPAVETTVSLIGGEERFLDYRRSANGELVLTAGQATKLFDVKNLDQRPAQAGRLGRLAFVIDLPDRTMKEANRENNVGGAFYYVIDPAHPVRPAVPAVMPLPPAVGAPDVLDPDAECYDAPALKVTQTLLIDGQPINASDVTIGVGEVITVRLAVDNMSGEPATDVTVCSSLRPQCFEIPLIAVGGTWRTEFSYSAEGGLYAVEATASGGTVGVVNAPGATLMVNCDAYTVVPLDPDPNPDAGASTVMRGGTANRWLRLISRRGGPARGIDVSVAVSSGGVTREFNGVTDDNGLVIVNGGPGIAIPFTAADPDGTTFDISVTGANGRPFTCSVPWQTSVTVKDFQYSTSYSRGFAISGSIGLIASVEGSAEAGFEVERGYTRDVNGIEQPTSVSLTPSAQLGLKTSVEVGVGPEFKLPLGITGSLSAGFSEAEKRTTSSAAKYAFTYPLDADEQCNILRVSLSQLGNSGPFVGWLIDAARRFITDSNCNPASKYLASMSTEFSAETSTAANIGLKVQRAFGSAITGDEPGDPDKFRSLQINFGAGGSNGFSFTNGNEVGFEFDTASNALRPKTFTDSYSMRGGVDWSLGFTAGLDEVDQDGWDQIATVEKKKNVQAELETFKKEVKGGLSGTTAELFKVDAEYDISNATSQLPSSISFTFAGPKASGWKAEAGGVAVPLTGPPSGSRSYTLSRREDIERVVTRLATLDAINKSTVIQLGASQQLFFEPTVLQQEYGRFLAALQRSVASYRNSESLSKGIEFPIGLTIKGLVVKAGLSAGVKADAKIGYTREKGAVVEGRSYALEQYPRALFPAQPELNLWDSIETPWRALLGSFSAEISDQAAQVTRSGGLVTLQSTNTATITINGATEPADFTATLFSWKYRSIDEPVRDLLQQPGDAAGIAGLPHYGIGGFHALGPDEHVLAVPTNLTIDWRDPDIVGLDEQTFAMYRWNELRRDWDYVGGLLNTASNTVTASIQRFGLYTLGAPMPAGTISMTVTDLGLAGDGPTAVQRFRVTSAPLALNTGAQVPDGAGFTVRPVAGQGTNPAPYGTVLTSDADAQRAGTQVAAAGGVITFEVEFPAPGRVYVPGRVVVYGAPGTAFGERVLVKEVQQ